MKAVVRRDEVEAARRRVGVDVGTPLHPLHHGRDHAAVTPDEGPHVVAEPTVPLHPRPSGKGVADLVRRHVPRLGDQADPEAVPEFGDPVDGGRHLLDPPVLVPAEDRARSNRTRRRRARPGVRARRRSDRPQRGGLPARHCRTRRRLPTPPRRPSRSTHGCRCPQRVGGTEVGSSSVVWLYTTSRISSMPLWWQAAANSASSAAGRRRPRSGIRSPGTRVACSPTNSPHRGRSGGRAGVRGPSRPDSSGGRVGRSGPRKVP